MYDYNNEKFLHMNRLGDENSLENSHPENFVGYMYLAFEFSISEYSEIETQKLNAYIPRNLGDSISVISIHIE